MNKRRLAPRVAGIALALVAAVLFFLVMASRQSTWTPSSDAFPFTIQATPDAFADNVSTQTLVRDRSPHVVKTNCGSRLVLMTSATQLAIDTYNDLYVAYPTLTEIGIRVDGRDYCVLQPSKMGSLWLSVALPTGRQKTIEIVNGPQTTCGTPPEEGTWIGGVMLNAPTLIVRAAVRPRLTIYGDSITVGSEATNAVFEGWAVRLRQLCAASVLLEAWGSRCLWEDCCTEKLRAEFIERIALGQPDSIWLAIGTNDYGLSRWTPSEFGSAYAALLDDLHEIVPGVLYCQTPIVRHGEDQMNKCGHTLDEYRNMIQKATISRAAFCKFIDGRRILSVSDCSDGLHPNTMGHAKYAAFVAPILAKDFPFRINDSESAAQRSPE